MIDNDTYINGWIERTREGRYEGSLRIDGVDISPIEATFFKDDKSRMCVWLKRKPMLEYDAAQHIYVKRSRKPHWETYLVKSKSINNAFNGEFMFLRFKYSIFGQWDITSQDKTKRMNIYIERLPMNEQVIINNIKKRANDNR